MDLPTGFRFHPTDEEIITHYLMRKAIDNSFQAVAIAEVDMNKCEPWDLPKKSKMGEKENYFFCQRDRKYPTGLRTNRATDSGYWKATGKDKEIYDNNKRQKNCLVGMKKTLVFYKGRAPKGEKTNWIMHEYRLEGRFSYYNLPNRPKDEWVVCRVFHKNTGINNRRSPLRDLARADSFLDHFLNDDDPSLPPLMDNEIPCCSTDKACSIFPRDDEEELKVAGLESSSGKLFMPAYYNYANKNSMEASSSSTTCQNSNLYYCHPPSLNPISTTNIRDDNYCSEKRHQNSCFKVTSPPPGYNYQQANSSNVSAAIQGVLQSNRKYCKMEPFYSSNINNNNSMLSPSQDTGISYDLAPEISSIHQNNKSYREDLPGVSVDPSMSDLDSLWEYY